MRFNKQRTWFSEDGKWAVIKRFSDNKLVLYRKGKVSYFDFTGHIFETPTNIYEYIRNHK